MRAFHVIFRLDFQRNFKMLNEPGTVAKLIGDTAPKDFFDFFGEDRANRRILVKHLSGSRYRALTVEPTAIVCDLETRDGVLPEALSDDGDFVPLCSVASALLKEFSITKLERAGLRLLMFGTNAKSVESAVRACRGLVASDARAAFEELLGQAADVGIAADGVSDAKVSYHLRFGPFVGADEYAKYFSNINELLPKKPQVDSVIDLDLFELKFNYTTSSVIKWCVPKLDTAAAVAKRVAEVISKESAK
jgi:hypothetical protein